MECARSGQGLDIGADDLRPKAEPGRQSNSRRIEANGPEAKGKLRRRLRRGYPGPGMRETGHLKGIGEGHGAGFGHRTGKGNARRTSPGAFRTPRDPKVGESEKARKEQRKEANNEEAIQDTPTPTRGQRKIWTRRGGNPLGGLANAPPGGGRGTKSPEEYREKIDSTQRGENTHHGGQRKISQYPEGGGKKGGTTVANGQTDEGDAPIESQTAGDEALLRHPRTNGKGGGTTTQGRAAQMRSKQTRLQGRRGAAEKNGRDAHSSGGDKTRQREQNQTDL